MDLIDPTHSALAATVENIADAVTHARFVGADQASDGVVLMKIVQVLRTLMLNPEGSALTNESVCEVMLSCFRICFETRLNELLRSTAEHALKDIVLLLFMRLPQFSEERHTVGLVKKLKMIAGGQLEQTKHNRKSKSKIAAKPPVIRKDSIPLDDIKDEATTEITSPNVLLKPTKSQVLATTPATPISSNIVDMQGKIMQTPTCAPTSEVVVNANEEATALNEEQQELLQKTDDQPTSVENNMENDADIEDHGESIKDNCVGTGVQSTVEADNKGLKQEDFINSMGVRFTPGTENGKNLWF